MAVAVCGMALLVLLSVLLLELPTPCSGLHSRAALGGDDVVDGLAGSPAMDPQLSSIRKSQDTVDARRAARAKQAHRTRKDISSGQLDAAIHARLNDQRGGSSREQDQAEESAPSSDPAAPPQHGVRGDAESPPTLQGHPKRPPQQQPHSSKKGSKQQQQQQQQQEQQPEQGDQRHSGSAHDIDAQIRKRVAERKKNRRGQRDGSDSSDSNEATQDTKRQPVLSDALRNLGVSVPVLLVSVFFAVLFPWVQFHKANRGSSTSDSTARSPAEQCAQELRRCVERVVIIADAVSTSETRQGGQQEEEEEQDVVLDSILDNIAAVRDIVEDINNMHIPRQLQDQLQSDVHDARERASALMLRLLKAALACRTCATNARVLDTLLDAAHSTSLEEAAGQIRRLSDTLHTSEHLKQQQQRALEERDPHMQQALIDSFMPLATEHKLLHVVSESIDVRKQVGAHLLLERAQSMLTNVDTQGQARAGTATMLTSSSSAPGTVPAAASHTAPVHRTSTHNDDDDDEDDHGHHGGDADANDACGHGDRGHGDRGANRSRRSASVEVFDDDNDDDDDEGGGGGGGGGHVLVTLNTNGRGGRGRGGGRGREGARSQEMLRQDHVLWVLEAMQQEGQSPLAIKQAGERLRQLDGQRAEFLLQLHRFGSALNERGEKQGEGME